MSETDTKQDPSIGHKECKECGNSILDLTGYSQCNECGGEWF
jgi:hypothetical protein